MDQQPGLLTSSGGTSCGVSTEMVTYCEEGARGGFWGAGAIGLLGLFCRSELHSNRDRAFCVQLNAIRFDYTRILEYFPYTIAGQEAAEILGLVGQIEEQLDSGETCLVLSSADAPSLQAPPGLIGLMYRIAGGTWEVPAGTDAAFSTFCEGWAIRLAALAQDLVNALTRAGDMERAEVVAALFDSVETAIEQADVVLDVSKETLCENAPEACRLLKAIGWGLAAYVGFQAYTAYRVSR